eukprot:gnl/Dysnectes_brevis/4311_a5732_743.p1 GENE.gnl/Dysnectes_brevis/4311_a5732_743~~gnl/Dysnectes_brevis/4311_a5732_743.p1  ORF type:complete len:253 (-),score=54.85 gnl/Dysnectes_brevis/4311_a5732_743:31-789(-)
MSADTPVIKQEPGTTEDIAETKSTNKFESLLSSITPDLDAFLHDPDSFVAKKKPFNIALICKCNINRSLAAHKSLVEHGLTDTESFGVADSVLLPTNTEDPLSFAWGTPYTSMLHRIQQMDPQQAKAYERGGIIEMLKRNAKIKDHPESFLKLKTTEVRKHRIILAFEHALMPVIVEFLLSQPPFPTPSPVHIFAVNVRDTIKSGRLAADCALLLHRLLSSRPLGADGAMDDVVLEFLNQKGITLFHTVVIK